MKKMCFILSLLIVSIGLSAQDYYWYKGQKIFLRQGDERYVLFNPNSKPEIDTSAYIKISVASSNSQLMWGIQKQSTPITSEAIYTSPSFFVESDSSNIYVTERFYVKLKHPEDYETLLHYATAHDLEIVEKGDFPLWYVLACTENSKTNALDMANLFYESGLFAVAEPEFMNVYRAACVNDALFGQQWNLLNTGQQNNNYTGLDINYCDTRTITTGVDSIIIAVIDQGIASHLDVSHLHSLSLDAHTYTSPAQVYTPHGTQCAGIIAAHTNLNNYGVAGIAPDCSLLSVSFKEGTLDYNLFRGMKYAVDNGASVLNNSWVRTNNRSEYVDNAIEYALTEGRNGKGCVVVFATGNDNSNQLDYPANSNPDIIAVGAMSPDATRAVFSNGDGSNYGQNLDVVAPGANISTTVPSTDPHPFIGDFCNNFSGTSAACAHVSAIAGLVLSVNPELTQKEVAEIIESTAQKVGTYSYDSVAPHGSWNNEMGYGLVDAYAAVIKAELSKIYIEGSTYACDSSLFRVHNVPNGATIQWSLGNAVLSALRYKIVGSNSRDSVLLAYEAPILDFGNGEDTKGQIGPDQPPHPPVSQEDSSVTLSVTVSLGGLSYTRRKTIYNSSLGKPVINATNDNTLWPINTLRSFIQTECTEVADDSITWEVLYNTPSGSSIVYQTTGQILTYTPTVIGSYSIMAINTEKHCNATTDTKNYEVVESAKKSLKKHTSNETPTKFLRDGQLYIIHENQTYNKEGIRIK